MSALRQATEAVLKRWDSPAWDWNAEGPTADLMADLRAALAAEPEPVRWVHPSDLELPCCAAFAHPTTDAAKKNFVPLYAEPPARQPLTEDWVRSRCAQSWVFETALQWARAVERAHGIGSKE